jgi:hypothetical protein
VPDGFAFLKQANVPLDFVVWQRPAGECVCFGGWAGYMHKPTARERNRKPLTFFTSERTPSTVLSTRATETLASTRNDPSANAMPIFFIYKKHQKTNKRSKTPFTRKVAVARADGAEDAKQFGHKGSGLFTALHDRGRDNLHETHAGAVEIDAANRGEERMDALPRILLELQPLNGNPQRRILPIHNEYTHTRVKENAMTGRHQGTDVEKPVFAQRDALLRYLVVVGHVRVKVVLAVKVRHVVHAAVQGQGRLDARLPPWELSNPRGNQHQRKATGRGANLDGAAVEDGQRAREAQVEKSCLTVGRGCKVGAAAAEQLGRRLDLRVDFQPDRRTPNRSHFFVAKNPTNLQPVYRRRTDQFGRV